MEPTLSEGAIDLTRDFAGQAVFPLLRQEGDQVKPDVGRGDRVPLREEIVPHLDQGALRLAELADAA
jgi:hypothetical protein